MIKNQAPRNRTQNASAHATLFDPFTVRDVVIPNRIMVSPMCQYSALDGYANDWHLVHLATRAVGRAGIVMVEASAVQPNGRISHWDMGIWEDGHIDMLARIARDVRDQGSVPAIQIGHAGRKASQRRPWEGRGPLPIEEEPWTTVAPSPIPFDDGWPTPEPLTKSGIDDLIGAFRQAARRANEAGFSILEIHAAHGYLINQFLSESTNTREDQYGGSFQNRIRLACEVVGTVRDEWPETKPLFIRLSATDWIENGWGIDQTIDLVRELKLLGVDVADVSSGGNSPHQVVPNEEGYQVPFAREIRTSTGVPTVAVGLIRRPAHADSIIRDGEADIVAMGREFLRSPYWPYRAAEELDHDLDWPIQYVRSRQRRSRGASG